MMAGKPGREELQQRIQELEATIARQLEQDNTLERLFNLSLDLLCVANLDGYFLQVNQAFETLLGHSMQEFLEKPFIDFVHPDDKKATLEALQQLAAGESLNCLENRYRCKDGSYKWLEWTCSPPTREGLLYAVARDISVQTAMQQQLAAQNALFNNVLSNVPASIFWKDRNSVFLGVNNRFTRDAGLSAEDIIGKTDYDLAWTREQADFYRECDRKVMEDGEPLLNIEESQRQADGTETHLLTSKVPLVDESGRVTGILGIYMDISKRTQMENTLRESEARLQILFDSAPEFIFVVDSGDRILRINRYACEHSGYTVDEMIGHDLREFFTEKSQHILDRSLPDLRENGRDQANLEFECMNGDVIDMECTATTIPSGEGEPDTFLIIQRDVTERNRVTTALSISEQRFRTIFNSSYQFIGILGPDGTLLEANQTALDLGGLKQEDVIGRPFWDTCWWRHSTEVQDRLKAAIKEASQGKPSGYEEEVLAANHAIRTIEFTLKPVANNQGETVLIILEGKDITEKKHADEELLRHHQEIAHVIRLSTAGEMASGMAHELNQPLTALVSYCGTALALLKTLPEPQQQLREILECASEQAHRAGRIIHHLREFVSKDNNAQQPVEIDLLIKDLNFLLISELKHANVQLVYHLHSRGCIIMANRVQIEQVLINLVRNSVEAIRAADIEDGVIILETRTLDDGSVEVTVTDNGPGINANMMETLFNPFQTSKTSGMGMGLSISRSIIEAHGGKLLANNQSPRGVTFRINLPSCG
jgi:PAS domain S-box-containing protein